MVILRSTKIALFDTLNGTHPSVRFTYEAESEGRIAFVDVAIHKRTGGALKTTVHKESCNTGQILHYKSGHPLEQKHASVQFLLSHSIKITLDPAVRLEAIRGVNRNQQRRGTQRNLLTTFIDG